MNNTGMRRNDRLSNTCSTSWTGG